jgi:glutamate synthase domain-containing protein 1
MGEVDQQAHGATQGACGRNPRREQDACGVGCVARASGERSHDVLNRALLALARVAHRGAASTDTSGDGAGLLTQIPHRLFWDEAAMLDLPLNAGQPFAVGAFCASDELDER